MLLKKTMVLSQQRFTHVPVLLNEILCYMQPATVSMMHRNDAHLNKKHVFIDATFGLGGYTRALLQTFPNSMVYAFDLDYASNNGHVRQCAQEIEEQFGTDRFKIFGQNFKNMYKVLPQEQIGEVDGVVFDLGVSSMQLDDRTRGFSFRPGLNALLDMRMAQISSSNEQYITAKTVVNELSEQELFNIIHEYGEDKFAKRITQAIVSYRRKATIETTQQLAQVIRSSVPNSTKTSNKDAATRTFQAIRIYVNDELTSLRDALIACKDLLRAPGGRLCVVSYHSLEDRIAKRFLQYNSSKDQPLFKVIVKEPVIPNEKEIALNPRSRSAKLRVGERTGYRLQQ